MMRRFFGAALVFGTMMQAPAQAQTITYTVNSTADADDGTCDAANCTLREAIAAANAGPSLDSIAFAISGPGTKRIEPLAPLPTIVNPVVIDGTTQPGYVETPLIDLLGASAGAATVGLTLSADGCTVKGLRVRGFATGILIDGGAGNLIGGAAASQSNEIIDNSGAGVRIAGAAATGNRVQWNTIAGNGGPGVTLPDAGTGNAIALNSISENGGLGIDLGDDGVTPNDAGDADTGPNDLRNYPVMDKAVFGALNRAEGTVDTRPNTDLTVEFYSNESCDATGHGEGLTLHGFTDVTSDTAGDAEFSFTLVGNVPLGWQVTATATDADGNTSEFSNCAAATTYGIYASPDSGLVWRGGSDEYAVFATPEGGAWGQLVTMSCDNLPGVTTCEFTPDTFTLGATEFRSNLIVTTTDLSRSSAPVSGGGAGPALYMAVLIVGLGLLGLAVAAAAGRSGGRAHRLGLRAAALAAVVIGLAFYAACSDNGTTEVIDAGTPRGKHTFTIVASSKSLTATTSAILVVK